MQDEIDLLKAQMLRDKAILQEENEDLMRELSQIKSKFNANMSDLGNFQKDKLNMRE